MEERRYRSLQTIATIFRVLGYVAAVLGTLGVVIGAFQTASDTGAAAGLATLVFGGIFVAFYVLFFFATAAFIRLAIDIEANTRRTAELLTQRSAE